MELWKATMKNTAEKGTLFSSRALCKVMHAMLVKKGWLTAPKDALCLYNVLPTSEAAEILFFLPLSLSNFCSSVIIYIIRHCRHIDR